MVAEELLTIQRLERDQPVGLVGPARPNPASAAEQDWTQDLVLIR